MEKIEANNSVNNFIELLKKIGKKDSIIFFNSASSIFKNISISKKDERITFGTSGNRQLTITIGQRYCICFIPTVEKPWQFILPNKIPVTQFIQLTKFDGKPSAFFCKSKNSQELFNNLNEITAASKLEIERVIVSGYRKHNNEIFEKAVFDENYKDELFEKAFGNNNGYSDNIWKLGCNWGSHKPSFYNLIKEKGIVIGIDEKKYSVGDLIMITEGHLVKAIAKIYDSPISVTGNKSLKNSFEPFEIEYENWVNYSRADWYELDEKDRFDFKIQQGICKIHNADIKKRVIDLWNNRNSNCWIFQCNPNAFDFEKAIRNNLLDSWTVSAHKDKIKIGDKIILWISGKESGCYALAEITSEPHINTKSKDSHLWKTEDKNQLKAGIKITHNLIDSPLLWSKIKEVKGLENLKVGNQGTNFSATKNEFKIITDLINDLSGVKNNSDMHAKNIILYGPPGTGKTYNSIDKAVEIATGKSGVHSDNKKVFDELRSKGQIEFVTFHQNYSYEDFMVGLRPDIENEQLRFRAYKGIFYEIAKRARENYLASKEHTALAKTFDEVFNEIIKPLVEENKGVEIIMASGIKYTITDVSETTIHFKKPSGGTQHTLSIQTLEDVVEGTKKVSSGLAAYYYPLVNLILEKRKPLDSTEKEKGKNFVLVIDEINRANISKVFGELITLLEDDKRLGEENELKISLPNGEKEFGVPPNLYIIGTMNTADKSIALIDIALRRRFEFIGKYPDYSHLNSEESVLLQKINEAIFKEKKSADFLIGHAYFMKQKQIVTVLNNKVVPLLMEYFSGKTDIVSNIFSLTDWSVTYNSTNFSWNISPK